MIRSRRDVIQLFLLNAVTNTDISAPDSTRSNLRTRFGSSKTGLLRATRSLTRPNLRDLLQAVGDENKYGALSASLHSSKRSCSKVTSACISLSPFQHFPPSMSADAPDLSQELSQL